MVQDSDISPGLIVSVTPEQLIEQVLIRSATALLSGLSSIPRLDVFPLLSVDKLSSGERLVLGGATSSGEIRKALVEGAGVVSVLSHSDGIDAYLGPQLTLCPVGHPSTGTRGEQSPRCLDTGVCHRHARSWQEAKEAGLLISPSELRAQILVMDICSGLLFNSNVTAPRWGLLPAFAASPAVGCMITRWSIVTSSGAQIESLLSDLARGIPVGEALTEFRNVSYGKGLGHRFCLIGDPRARANCSGASTPSEDFQSVATLFSSPESDVQITGASRQTHSGNLKTGHRAKPQTGREETNKQNLAKQDQANSDFLYTLLDGDEMILPEREAAYRREALQALSQYRDSSGSKESGTQSKARHGATLRSAVIRFLFSQDTILSKKWLQFVESLTHSTEHTGCYHCGALTDEMVANFKDSRFLSRKLRICSVCGITEDLPLGMSLAFHVGSDLKVYLDRRLPAAAWMIGLHLGTPLRTRNFGWFWPRDSRNKPHRCFQIPEPVPLGPLRLSLIFMLDSQIGVVGKFWRAPEGISVTDGP